MSNFRDYRGDGTSDVLDRGVVEAGSVEGFWDAISRTGEQGEYGEVGDLEEYGAVGDDAYEQGSIDPDAMENGQVYYADGSEVGYMKLDDNSVVQVEQGAVTKVVVPPRAAAKPAARPPAAKPPVTRAPRIIPTIALFQVLNAREESFEPLLVKPLRRKDVQHKISSVLQAATPLDKETGIVEATDGTVAEKQFNAPVKTPVAMLTISGGRDAVRPNMRFDIEVVKRIAINGVDATDGTYDEISTRAIVRSTVPDKEVIVIFPAFKRIGNGNVITDYQPVAGNVLACYIRVSGLTGLIGELNWGGTTDPGMRWLAEKAGMLADLPVR